MRTEVRLFARLRELAGADSVVIEIQAPARILELKQSLIKKYPEFSVYVDHLLFAIGTRYAECDTAQISPNDEIACFLPVSGG
ncbi:MoaD/ThiS family protein [Schlesneria paludicola]|uniref:MoaD/ThiS family protein n=1 Tax=Schlesneria paludicola TaxID=360056 RepID=UPI00029B56F3